MKEWEKGLRLQISELQPEDEWYISDKLEPIAEITKEAAEILIPIVNMISFLDKKIKPQDSDYCQGQRYIVDYIVGFINGILQTVENKQANSQKGARDEI